MKGRDLGAQGTTDLPAYSLRAPAVIPGIDLSDHRSYWPHGIKALMITDTAFYRNTAYHSGRDTADRLDYVRMKKLEAAGASNGVTAFTFSSIISGAACGCLFDQFPSRASNKWLG